MELVVLMLEYHSAHKPLAIFNMSDERYRKLGDVVLSSLFLEKYCPHEDKTSISVRYSYIDGDLVSINEPFVVKPELMFDYSCVVSAKDVISVDEFFNQLGL